MIRTESTGGGVFLITLDRPKVNALCVQLLTELEVAARSVAAEGARAVVVTGGDKVFAAGADITEFAQNPDPESFAIAEPGRVGEIGRSFLDALGAVADLPCPTIAGVNGVALGGGCELALACDFRLAAESAKFGQPEILLGIIPGGGGTQRLARLVGPARAKDLVFSGRTVDVLEAESMGLVDRVTDGDATSAALEWARRLASGPPSSTAIAKRAIDRGLEGTLEQGLALEQELFVESFSTPDAAIGVASFLREGPGHADFGS
ncbi:MAG: enoyl-CoA hydratase/isomerase family protein [Microthrixaceae bacterium]